LKGSQIEQPESRGRKPNRTIQVEQTGKIAWEILKGAQKASVIGVTSRGAFLNLGLPQADALVEDAWSLALPLGQNLPSLPNWVIFLSLEHFGGPLSLNLRETPGLRLDLALHSPATILAEGIHLPFNDLLISGSGARLWQATAPQVEVLAPELRSGQTRAIIQYARQAAPDSRLAELLAVQDENNPFASSGSSAERRLYSQLQQACRQKNEPERLLKALESFLGLGSGLTPAGDDLVCGFLLAVGRYQQLFSAGLVAMAGSRLIASAARATSSLSASLIACAGCGQADERLIQGLDSLVTGVPDAQACVASLARYGNSSGFDALLGMIAALDLATDTDRA
jgi:hypothetical protein